MSAARAVRRFVVLIAAIGVSAGVLASPAAAATPNSWRQAAPMTTARFGQAAAALSGDRVLLAGGEDGGFNDLKSATIYNAASDTWTPAADMGTARIAPGAVTLPSGKVLVVGGGNPAALTNALDTGEVYDPGTNSWTPVTNTMSSARGQGPVTMLLATGRGPDRRRLRRGQPPSRYRRSLRPGTQHVHAHRLDGNGPIAVRRGAARQRQGARRRRPDSGSRHEPDR